MKEIPLTTQRGSLEVVKKNGSVDLFLGDVGIQASKDGRIWICLDGESFLRFKPLTEKQIESIRNRMKEVKKELDEIKAHVDDIIRAKYQGRKF